ncbi:MAG: YdeI/OmpD-associated family protein, partial [Ilumatobacteraceae bacterium]
FTPRRARSPWSQVNRERVERLIAVGRMRPTGQTEIDRAKADGRWDAAYRQRTATVPPDLQQALDASPGAAAAFADLSSQNRFAILFRLGNVKRQETQARKISEYIAMLERGETIHPQKARR